MSLMERPTIGSFEPVRGVDAPLDDAVAREIPERRWRGGGGSSRLRQPDRRSVRSLLIALVLACATLMTLDHQADTVLEPVREGLGSVLGPVEDAAADAIAPVAAVPQWFRTQRALRAEVADLRADNADLKRQLATNAFDRGRLSEYDKLTASAKDLGVAMVPARVIARGPAQSFSRTVTIDAGSSSGLRADLTVVNGDGLVGRVLRTTKTTATVLLILDGNSVVGARIGDGLEAGYLRGRGVIGNDGRLDLELVDGTVIPAKGDPVVTWGSRDGAPYVGGIPVGAVTQVFANLRDQTQRAVIEPYVDFSALDRVGVIVPSGTTSDRAVIEADGSLQ